MCVIQRNAKRFAKFIWNFIVILPICIQTVIFAAPCVELPVDGTNFAVIVYNKSRGGIPCPCIIGIYIQNFRIFNTFKASLCVSKFFVACKHKYLFKLRNFPYNFRKNLFGKFCLIAPTSGSFGPNHNGGRMF